MTKHDATPPERVHCTIGPGDRPAAVVARFLAPPGVIWSAVCKDNHREKNNQRWDDNFGLHFVTYGVHCLVVIYRLIK